MRLREGLPYMIAGSAIVMAYLGLRNGKAKNMINNVMNNIKNRNMNELEDMM
ncbi:MAG: hypothetical protein ACOXZS_05030 [Bacilli bacterium]|jgi:hypothetical protein